MPPGAAKPSIAVGSGVITGRKPEAIVPVSRCARSQAAASTDAGRSIPSSAPNMPPSRSDAPPAFACRSWPLAPSTKYAGSAWTSSIRARTSSVPRRSACTRTGPSSVIVSSASAGKGPWSALRCQLTMKGAASGASGVTTSARM